MMEKGREEALQRMPKEPPTDFGYALQTVGQACSAWSSAPSLPGPGLSYCRDPGLAGNPPSAEAVLAHWEGLLGEAVGLEMEHSTDGQGARDSLSPTKGPWVFTALGTVCKLRPPCFLHS